MYQKVNADNYCVYAHILPDGKMYIGMTGLKLKQRSNNGKGYVETPAFWKAIQEVGWENIKHIVLIEGINKEVARVCEKELILKYQTYDSCYGYNLMIGGNHTDVTRRKSKAKHIVVRRGWKHTLEARKKMSEVKKGKPLSDAQKAHMKKLNERNRDYWLNRRLKRENF